MKPRLFIGNRNYSSWSLRPGMALRWAGIDHEQTVIDLDQPGYGEAGIAAIAKVSPTGRVPALHVAGAVVWDSLAICEWASEAGASPLLPSDAVLRARVRSAVAEMHSGFAALRRDLPMNVRRRCVARGLPEDTRRDVARVDALWSQLCGEFAAAGPYLFGTRGLADAFFMPVVTRFRTYGIGLSAAAQAYCETMLADPAFREWEAAALAEPARFSATDALYA